MVKTRRYTEKQAADLIREVVVLSGVSHPNVVAYKHSFFKSSSVYIVMEYAERGTLKSNLSKYGKRLKLSERRILRYFVQILLALMHLHKEQILHRDLKTENIFLSADGLIKLGDFGVSRVLGNTLAATRAGTPHYVSPEIVGGELYAEKADVWSLGVVLYEMVMGKMPFRPRGKGEGLPELLDNIVNMDVRVPKSRGVSRKLRDLVHDLLEKDPDDRPSLTSVFRRPFIQDAFDALPHRDLFSSKGRYRPGSSEGGGQEESKRGRKDAKKLRKRLGVRKSSLKLRNLSNLM